MDNGGRRRTKNLLTIPLFSNRNTPAQQILSPTSAAAGPGETGGGALERPTDRVSNLSAYLSRNRACAREAHGHRPMLTIDLSAFERRARELDGQIDQVPFALSKAMNQAARETRQKLISETWPRAVTVRKPNFLRAALMTEWATKANLTVAIVDVLDRAHLSLHAKGGTKQGKGRIAVPTAAVRRGASGVARADRPRNIKRVIVRGNLIFRAEGRGKASRLRLMFKLIPNARIKKDVPFIADFERLMTQSIRDAFPDAMAKAMASRRR